MTKSPTKYVIKYYIPNFHSESSLENVIQKYHSLEKISFKNDIL